MGKSNLWCFVQGWTIIHFKSPTQCITFDCINIFLSVCLEGQTLPRAVRKVTVRTVKMLELA